MVGTVQETSLNVVGRNRSPAWRLRRKRRGSVARTSCFPSPHFLTALATAIFLTSVHFRQPILFDVASRPRESACLNGGRVGAETPAGHVVSGHFLRSLGYCVGNRRILG